MQMPRKPRIHYPGALYHVMVKGNNGEKVFFNELNKNKYLGTIALYKAHLGFKLYAFCVLDNHAHLLIEVQDVALSQIMQRIQQVYTQWFNRKYQRTGHVFQQRYKALLCNKDDYYLQLIRYIHNNPVRANLQEGIEYKWSSHLYYIGNRKGSLVNTFEPLSLFSENEQEALRQYMLFMNQDSENLGLKSIQIPQSDVELAARDNINKRESLSLDEIISRVCINENVNISDLLKRTKVQQISDIRKAIVLISSSTNITNASVAQKLNLSPSMISKIRSGTSKGTAYVNDVIRRWEEA